MAKWWRGLTTKVPHCATSLTPSPPLFSRACAYHTIQAIPRELRGSGVSAKDRVQGRIPAVVFSQSLLDKDPANRFASRKQLLTTEKDQIQSIIKSVQLPFFCSTTFPLQIRAGSGSSVLLESGRVLPIKARRFISLSLFLFFSRKYLIFIIKNYYFFSWDWLIDSQE